MKHCFIVSAQLIPFFASFREFNYIILEYFQQQNTLFQSHDLFHRHFGGLGGEAEGGGGAEEAEGGGEAGAADAGGEARAGGQGQQGEDQEGGGGGEQGVNQSE